MDVTKIFLQLLGCFALVSANFYVEEMNTTDCGAYRIEISPMDVIVPYETVQVVQIYVISEPMGCKIEISSMFSGAAKLATENSTDFTDVIAIPMESIGQLQFYVRGDVVGISRLVFRVKTANNTVSPGEISTDAKVARGPSHIMTGFTYFVGVMAIFNMLVLGCRSNLAKMREFIPKNKKAVVLGVFCPMFFLPLTVMCFILGFTFGLEGSVNAFLPVESLLLITIAVLPGGGLATPWIRLTGGCTVLDYSSMMVITLLSLGSAPLLYFLLGLIWYLDVLPLLQYHALRLAVWQVILIAAYTLGLILRFFNRKGVWRMVKFFLLPFSICFVLALIAFGLYSNVYIFFIRRGWVALTALLFPWAAYFFGLVTAVAFRLPWKQIKTVTMNSGVCQPVLAMAVFQWSRVSPESDLGLYMAFIVLLGSYLPLIIVAIISVSMRCCCGGNNNNEDAEKVLPAGNGDANGGQGISGEDNWGMAAEEGTSENDVNIELQSDATTAIVEDKSDQE